MSKKLKRRIREACGLDSLPKEDRVKRAMDILDDPVEKQAVCNKVLGASHKDVEMALREACQKKYSKQEAVYKELEDEVPYKLNPELVIIPVGDTPTVSGLYTPDETAALVTESLTSKAIQEITVAADPDSYPSYMFEEVAALVANDYHPDMFRYINHGRRQAED